MCSHNRLTTRYVHCKARRICKLKVSICNTEPLSKHQGHEFILISSLNYNNENHINKIVLRLWEIDHIELRKH